MTREGRRLGVRRAVRRKPAVVIAGPVAALVLAGCTGVPTASKPQTVEPIGGAQSSTSQALGPPADAGPGAIVDTFLDANAASPSSANKWLTSLARQQWSGLTVTVIADRSTSIYDPRRRTVSVTGRVLGTLTANGVFIPQLGGAGNGVAQTFQFGMTAVGGQYRIDSLQKGLLVDAGAFSQRYQQHELYFYDRANRYLVPDLRYSALQDPAKIAGWLLEQLVLGPRPELVNSVNTTDTLPAEARVRVTLGPDARVLIPGAAQFGSDVRNRLAAQLSETLDGVLRGTALSIVDGKQAVRIPQAGGPLFTTANFPTATGPPAPAGDVYYLHRGRIVTATGKALSGPLDLVSLQSIAVARPTSIGQLAVAAVQGDATGATGRLLVGTQSGGLHPTAVRGQLSRPAWAPGLAEFWIGDGSHLLSVDGSTGRAVEVSVPSAVGGGRIVAVRFSPDGSRVALVVSGVVSGQKQAVLLVGPVVRSVNRPPQVALLVPISPDGVVPTDVGWLDSTHLIATGYLAGTQDARIFDTLVDGSAWSSRGIGNLPVPPDSLTAATDELVWVSTPNGFVWEQSGPSSWVSPSDAGQTSGSQPVYLG